jgi:signal transduction histidine kinase
LKFPQLAADRLFVKPGSPSSNDYAFERLRVSILYEQSGLTQATGLVNAAIYVYASRGLVPTRLLVGWAAFMTAVVIGRYILYWAFSARFAQTARPLNPALWENLFVLGLLASAVGWGVASSVLLPSGLSAHSAFVAFQLAGLTAGAAVAYCTSIRSVHAFLLPSLLPMAVRLAASPGSLEHTLAVLLILYVVLFGGLTARINDYVVEAIRLRFEKERLLTELRDTQAKVVQSTKMAALGEMAGGIAHEINTPLAVIKGDCYHLRELAESSELSAEAGLAISDEIDATTDRIGVIVAGLRAFARDGTGEPFRLSPADDVIADTLDFCRRRFENHGVALTVETVGADVHVRCRRVQMGQVLLNLLNNAFDAVQDQPEKWVTIEVRSALTQFVIAVVDSGPGVPAALRDQIMLPFFTTKPVGRGTGLGLSIAKGIVEEHGGTLRLDVQAPHTRFVVSLPADQQQESAA